MNKNNKHKLLPKFRFPEFADSEEWEEKTLGAVSEIITGSTPSTNEPLYYGGEKMFVSPADINDERYIKQTKTTLTELGFSKTRKIQANSVLFVCIGSTIGKIAQNKLECATNQQLNSLVPHAGYSSGFIYSLLEANASKIALLAGKQAVPIINKTLFSSVSLLFPAELEQQKIAACLSSLDDLITAQAQKLEALKLHKKGLLQDLFPAEGETLPKIRFSEFADSGEWEKMKFNDVCKFIRGPFGGALKKEIFVSNGYAVYEQSHAIYEDFRTFRYFITEEKFNELKRFAVLPKDIIMSCSGTMGKFAVVPEKSKAGVINQALLKLTVKSDYEVGFIKTILELPINQNKLLSQSAGGAIKNVVEVAQIKEIPLLIPKLVEQQKIAACLSSLDDLIAAQTQKVEGLKLHKKGLLQGLFPNILSINE